MKSHIGKWSRLALEATDLAIEHTRKSIQQVEKIKWKEYFHPYTYSTEGIERIASAGLDIFIASGLFLFPLAGWMLGVGYILVGDALPFLQGQSLGKHFFGLRVVHQNTLKPITRRYKKSMIRGAVMLIPGLNIYDAVIYFTKGERIADQWAGTTVISERYNVSSDKGKEV
jgi:hypothetical protein